MKNKSTEFLKICTFLTLKLHNETKKLAVIRAFNNFKLYQLCLFIINIMIIMIIMITTTTTSGPVHKIHAH